MTNTDFAQKHKLEGLNPELAGNLAVAPAVHDGELVEGDRLQTAFTLLEKAAGLVAQVTEATDQRIEVVEREMGALLSGQTSIDELVTRYGRMSASEADSLKHQLSEVMHSMDVQIHKSLTERKGIQVQKERAFTALAGLKAAYQIQGESEKVADARDEAEYQGQVREQKNVTRAQDIEFRTGRNQLEKEDKSDRLSHQQQMNSFEQRIRTAIQKGAAARTELQGWKAARAVTATERVIGKIEAKTKKGGKKA